MAIKLQNKRSAEFSMASMSDLVFLLLIFFMITSTLISPNVINILLPKSDAKKQLSTGNIEIYIDGEQNYYINPKNTNAEPVIYEELLPSLMNEVAKDKAEQKIIILRADKTVPIACVIACYDVLNELNTELQLQEPFRYKLLLATEAKS